MTKVVDRRILVFGVTRNEALSFVKNNRHIGGDSIIITTAMNLRGCADGILYMVGDTWQNPNHAEILVVANLCRFKVKFVKQNDHATTEGLPI
jgi:hypothetical protein